MRPEASLQGRATPALSVPERQYVDSVRTGPIVKPVSDAREQKATDTAQSSISRGSANAWLNGDERGGVRKVFSKS